MRSFHQNGTVLYSGLFLDIINVLAEFINFNYTLTEPADGEFGRKGENGTWSGMIGQLVAKEVDLAIAPFVFTPSRAETVTFLTPLEQAEHSFIVALPSENTFSMYTRPFQRNAWLGFWMLGLAVAALTHLFEWICDRQHNMSQQYFLHYLHTFGYIFQQGIPIDIRRSATRILHASYWFILITLVGIYTGNLVAFMAVKKLKLPLNNLEELADHSDFEAAPYGGGTALDIFKSATSGVYKRVWDQNIQSMDNVFDMKDYKKALKRVTSENFVILGEVMSLRHFLREDNSCQMILSKTRFFKSHIGMAARKGFPYTDLFNKRILALQQAGLVDRLKKKYISDDNRSRCLNKLSTFVQHRTDLPHTIGAFLALGLGLLFATFSFVIEVMVFRHNNVMKERSRHLIQSFKSQQFLSQINLRP